MAPSFDEWMPAVPACSPLYPYLVCQYVTIWLPFIELQLFRCDNLQKGPWTGVTSGDTSMLKSMYRKWEVTVDSLWLFHDYVSNYVGMYPMYLGRRSSYLFVWLYSLIEYCWGKMLIFDRRNKLGWGGEILSSRILAREIFSVMTSEFVKIMPVIIYTITAIIG